MTVIVLTFHKIVYLRKLVYSSIKNHVYSVKLTRSNCTEFN